MDVFGGETVLITLDKEGQLPRGIRPRNRRIRSDYGFSFCIRESPGVGGFHDHAGGNGEKRRFVVVQLEDESCHAIMSTLEAVGEDCAHFAVL